jgi:hypothetical protein
MDADCGPGSQCLVDSDGDSTDDACTVDDLVAEWDPAVFGQYVVKVENESTSGDTVNTPYELLLGRTNVYGVGCPEDALESNDNDVNAWPISYPNTLALGACGDDDYFTFTAPSSGQITVDALFDGDELSFQLRVLDSGFSNIGIDNADVGNRRSVTFNATAGEDYIIGMLRKKLDPMDAEPPNGPYFLRID